MIFPVLTLSPICTIFFIIVGWKYRYYCPIPGCVHHILKCLEDDTKTAHANDVYKENKKDNNTPQNNSDPKIKSKYFANITSLKQHYSKV